MRGLRSSSWCHAVRIGSHIASIAIAESVDALPDPALSLVSLFVHACPMVNSVQSRSCIVISVGEKWHRSPQARQKQG